MATRFGATVILYDNRRCIRQLPAQAPRLQREHQAVDVDEIGILFQDYSSKPALPSAASVPAKQIPDAIAFDLRISSKEQYHSYCRSAGLKHGIAPAGERRITVQ